MITLSVVHKRLPALVWVRGLVWASLVCQALVCRAEDGPSLPVRVSLPAPAAPVSTIPTTVHSAIMLPVAGEETPDASRISPVSGTPPLLAAPTPPVLPRIARSAEHAPAPPPEPAAESQSGVQTDPSVRAERTRQTRAATEQRSIITLKEPQQTWVRNLSVDIGNAALDTLPAMAKDVFDRSPSRTAMTGNESLWDLHVRQRVRYVPYHLPLYFEDPNLERFGVSHGWLQPFVSGGLFFSTIPSLPYRAAAEPPWCSVQSLECGPVGWRGYVPPWSLRAAAVQAAATTGFIFIVP